MKVKVLVVDDDETTLEITKATLEDAGHEVLVRQTALGTAPFILRERPDVVVLDVQMPTLTGDEIAQVLQKHAKDLVLILFSSKSGEELQQLASECGAVGSIQKSGNARDFLHQFEHLVRMSEPQIVRRRQRLQGH